MKLSDLRNKYKGKTCIPRENFSGRNADKPFEFISDKDLVDKINSKEYKLHPKLPIIISFDGKEIYDIRDNFKCIIRHSTGRQRIAVSGYKGKHYVHIIVAEAWSKRIIKDNENVHHIDFNRNNNSYENLIIIEREKHDRIHLYTKKNIR